MAQPADTASDLRPGMSRRVFDLLSIALVFLAYTTVFVVALEMGPVEAIAGGIANTVPVVILAAVLRSFIIKRLVGAGVWVQILGHAVLSVVFGFAAYWLLTIGLGVFNAMSLTDFRVEPFPTRAMAWQLLQNFTTYALVAALAYIQARPDQVAVFLSDSSAETQAGRGPDLSRYFIRTGEDIQPIDVAAIVSITGADDYAEVATLQGKHLVRLTLAEFEKALDAATFIRVHRSRIINVERVARAEPAGGGRMLLHMENGEMISTSRAGARLLRDRVL